jgi:hypothetical protein
MEIVKGIEHFVERKKLNSILAIVGALNKNI